MASASSSIPLTTLAGPSHFLHERPPPPDSPTDIHDVFPDGPGILRSSASGENEPINTSTSSRAPAWKRELYALLEHPTSSPAAFVVHIFSTGLILISALVTILETVPQFHEISTGTWFGLETSLVALFTIEYIARCVAWSLSWRTLLQWVGCECNHTLQVDSGWTDIRQRSSASSTCSPLSHTILRLHCIKIPCV